MSNPQGKETRPAFESYIAVALQPKVYGCRNREDIQRNLKNLLSLLDNAVPTSYMVGGGPVKLVAFPEGSIQGFYDETSNMDHPQYCRDLAIQIPGPETDLLAEKARQWGIYIVAQAKTMDPDIAPDRFINQGFIISPEGEIILKHTKNIISVVEGSASPYDLWEKWSKKYGEGLEAYYPVAKTDIGNLAVSICAETMFPETYRAFMALGAEVIIRMTLPEPMVSMGTWDYTNRARAFDNACYLVCPNTGPYYMNPDEDQTYSLLGGHSMIVDYRGNVNWQLDHQNVAALPGDINIKLLREYRETSMHAAHLVQMRSGLWKQIYDRIPDYPKNVYAERTYPQALERHLLHLGFLQGFFEAGVFERPVKDKV